VNSGLSLIKCACLLSERDGRVLLVRVRDSKLWYLPGGTIEQGETAEEALIREVAEELGVVLDAASIRHKRSVIGPAYGREGLVELNCFSADWEGDLSPQAEVREAAWFGPDDADRVAPAIKILFAQLWPEQAQVIFPKDILIRKPRPAARLLMLDPDGAVLMFRFSPPGIRPFWATPGGAVDPGESYDVAARREMLEETGWVLDPGPEVAQRHAEFVTIEGEPVTSDERYYLVRVPERRIMTDGHTALEQAVMHHHHWWTADELRDSKDVIFPRDLAAMLRAIKAWP
jgi:8-oxo-dGTP diphosphatase